MHVLSRLRLRTKLALLLGLAALTVIASLAVAASMIHQAMIDGRIDKLRATTHISEGLARVLENQVKAGRLSHDQAIEQYRDFAHATRFDDGEGYISIQTLDAGISIVHGANPALEGKPMRVTNAAGRSLTDIISEALAKVDEAVISYSFVRPGQTTPEPKIAHVMRFAPWNAVFILGAYTADIDKAFNASLRELAEIAGAILVVTLLLAWLINRDVTTSLLRLDDAMVRLSEGSLDVAIPGTERHDEVGAMAKAALVFKDGMRQAERLRAEQETERARAESVRLAAMVGMAETIESETRDAIAEFERRTTVMTDAATEMSGSAERTGSSAESAAEAAALALTTAQTVATAAEQLTASIREIGAQVNQSNEVVTRAVSAGRTTRETMEALNQQVGRIGDVAAMISEIAARTNLLALNATIEAARAGEAGKGFAVVASEVKQLATQTARSTEEINRHITEVRGATTASVAAVGQIETTINEVNAIAGSIAAAVEEQSAATAEIARNVNETAVAANQMTERVGEVSAEAANTGRKAAEVLATTNGLNETLQGFRRALVRVVRTSSNDVDRRRSRRLPCHAEAAIAFDGQSVQMHLHDLSEHGCFAVGAAKCHAGQSVEIAPRLLGRRLRGRVMARSDEGMHIGFVDDSVAASDVERISLSTVADIVRVTKQDHLAFVQRVNDAATTGQPPAGGLASAHSCRLGRWYDSLTDPVTLALPAFQAIAEPHHAVHESGHRVLATILERDVAGTQRYLEEMRQHSQRVLRCLDEFGRDYAATLGGQTGLAAAA
jgi:methyl-accepting chemotaxis protein